MRKGLALILVFSLVSPALAQRPVVPVQIRVGTTDPTTCTPGSVPGERNLFWNTTSQVLKYCSATDTWTTATGGSSGIYFATDTGAVNAYVLNPTPAASSLVAGLTVYFTSVNANTAASTVNVSGLGVVNMTKNGSTALTTGDITSGVLYQITYDGTQWQLNNPGNYVANSYLATAANGGIDLTEGTCAALAAAVSHDLICANSSWHGVQVSNNNGTYSLLFNRMFVSTASTSVASTTSETSIIGTGTGTTTIPANGLIAGTTVRVTVKGYLSTDTTPTTLRVKVKLGSTVILDTLIENIQANIAGRFFEVSSVLVFRTIGATGTVLGSGNFTYMTTAAGSDNVFGMVNTATTTIDTTATQAIDCTAQWGTSSASNTITGAVAVVEVF